jgi:hypothetical protein
MKRERQATMSKMSMVTLRRPLEDKKLSEGGMR